MANNEVKLRLSVDGAKAVLSDFDRVRSGMSGVSDAATTTSSAMRALGAAFSVGAVVAWGKAMIDAADAMNDMSQRVGIAVKDLAKYELAASQSGTTMETLARGIKGLAGNLVEHGAALKKAGIDTSNADKAMQQLANVFASMPDGVEKTNLAVKLFGKAGMDMIPMLNLGAEGLQTAAEKTAAYATQMAAMAPLADAFNDNLSVMSLNSKTLGMTMFNEVLPSLVKVTDAMTKADDQGNSLASVFGKGLRTAFETVALIASDVIFVFQGVGREIGGIAAQVVAAATGNWSGFSAISDAMKEDAKKARIELDRFQENLVSRGEKVQTVYNKRQGFGEQVKSGTSGSTLLAALGADKAGTEAAKAANALLKERIELAKWNTKAVDELFDAQEKVRLQTEDQIKTARTTLEQIEFETRLLEMNTEQRAQATLERDLEREGIVKGTLAYDAYIVKLREAMAIKTGREDSIKAADDMREAQKKAAEESAKYWEDALMRAFESGKGFFQSLWDTIKNTLKTQVLKVLVSATGLTGMSAAGAGDLAGGGGNLLGTAANLGKMYDTITGGFTKLTATVSGNLQYAADWMMTSQSDLVASLGESLSANVGTLSSVAGYAAGAAAGLAIGKAISGGYGSNTAVNAGTIIGSVLGGPIGGAIGGAIGGLVNRAFGRKATELLSSGTRGTFAGDEFSGENYANYQKKGGWFRSDKNWSDITALAAETQQAWSTAFAGVKGSVAGMAASLGLATDSIVAYSKYVDVAAGTTEEQLTALFTSMADEMAAAAAPGLTAFKQTGETASTTLSRLGSSLNLANQWLSQFNDTLLASSLAGGDQASKLLAAFGGADQFASAQSAYYQVMYTDAQRLADTTVNVAKALALVNVAMPTTLDAYNALRNGLDVTTDAGRNAYTVMTLLGPEFAQVANAASAATQATLAATRAAADALAQTNQGWLDQLRVLQGLETERSLALRDATDDSTRAIMRQVYAQQDLQTATQAATEAAAAALDVARQTNATHRQLSDQLSVLLGTQTERDIALRDASDDTSRALLEQIYAQQDFQAALADTSATLTHTLDEVGSALTALVSSIASERTNVAGAVLAIRPAAMRTYAQIHADIAGVSVGQPSSAAVDLAKNAALSAGSNIAAPTTTMIDWANAAAVTAGQAIAYPTRQALDAAIAAADAAKAVAAAAVTNANTTVTTANATLANATANVTSLQSSKTSVANALAAANVKLAADQAYYVEKAAQSQAILVKYGAATGVNAYSFDTSTNRAVWNSAGYAPRDGYVQAQTIAEERGSINDWQAWYSYITGAGARPATNAESPWTALDGANKVMIANEKYIAELTSSLNQVNAALTTATTAQTAAQTAATNAVNAAAAAQTNYNNVVTSGQASIDAATAAYAASITQYQADVAAAKADAEAAVQQATATYVAQVEAYNAAVTAARIAANDLVVQAMADYAAQVLQSVQDAEKATKTLTTLREETMAYYAAQKELAGLMSTSAANLREAVRSSQFGQLNSSTALAQQQRDFARNYSLALATSGATKAGYADQLGAALPGLTTALMDTSSTRAEWALATAKLYTQSATIATQLEGAAAGMNYESESLMLLGSIDLALNDLDTNTAILRAAIDAGTATSAAGLRAVVTQLGGVPAFASGGYHTGGARIVGENGPELEVVGPSRIFNASQTRGLLQGGGGNTARLEALVERLTREVEALRFEARATATNTNKTNKILGRVTQDGESITTTVLAA